MHSCKKLLQIKISRNPNL